MLNPGSPEAIAKDCTCPSDTNESGQGAYTPSQTHGKHFLVHEDCPIHGKKVWAE